MTNITVSSQFDAIYSRALASNHIPFLLETSYDHELEMWTTTFTIKESDWTKARTVIEQARKEYVA